MNATRPAFLMIFLLTFLAFLWGESAAVPAGLDFGSFLRSRTKLDVRGESPHDESGTAGASGEGMAGGSVNPDDRGSGWSGPDWTFETISETVNGHAQSIHLLTADPDRVEILPVLSHDRLFGFETLSAMDARHDALASVNGWFSHGDGNADGLLLIGGQVLYPAAGIGPALVLEEGGASIEPVWTEVKVQRCMDPKEENAGTLSSTSGMSESEWQDVELPAGMIWQLNPWPMRTGYAVFTPAYGGADRLEAAHAAGLVELGRLRGFVQSNVEVEIPPKGWLVAAKGEKAERRLQELLRAGEWLRPVVSLKREDGTEQAFPTDVPEMAINVPNAADVSETAVDFSFGAADSAETADIPDSAIEVTFAGSEKSAASVLHAVEVGGWLVRDGRNVTLPFDRWAGAMNTPTPRTAVAVLADGRMTFMVVDGRQGDFSLGVTGTQLADLLIAHGAVDAALLDGGGSSEMIVSHEIVNRPSTGRERPIPFAFIVR